MKQRLQFIIGYFLSWSLLFLLGRLFFLCVTRKAPVAANFHEWSGVFIYGFRMDMSLAAYVTIPILLFALAGIWVSFFNRPTLYSIYTLLILIPIVFIFIADGNAFNAWGYRLDASVLSYLKNPQEAWASVSHLPVTLILLGFVVFIVLVFRFVVNLFRKIFPLPSNNKWIGTISLIILAGISIIPLRGGFQLAPINQSSVYFSSNNYANQAALNPVWNFIHSVRAKNELKDNPYITMNESEADRIVHHLFYQPNSLVTDTVIRKNIILIIWESFTAKVIDSSFNGVEITPGFNQLKKEGIYFDNIYATGDRTDKGIVGILSGYPSQPTNSIVKHPDKSRTLPLLTETFNKRGYFTGFYYGGEPAFANIKSYLMHGPLDEIVDVNSFDKADRNSKWGAHDGVVMKYLLNRLNTLPQPYFTTWLTLSSHEPYETPVVTAIPGDDDEAKFLNSLHYTDEVVTAFVELFKKSAQWNNTILVIIADHGHRLPPTKIVSRNFRIPLLIIGGGIQPRIIEGTGSQTDLAATLTGYMGLPQGAFPFSRNMLDSSYRPWAWYSFNNGFGYIKPKSQVVYDHVGNRLIYSSGEVDSADFREGKALQQVFYGDFLKRGVKPAGR